MTEDAPPLASHAGDLARLYNSVNDAGGRAALERVAQRISELTADNEALRKQLAERGSAEEAVDSIPGLVVALAPDGEVEFVNRQGVEFFGQPLAELKHWGTNGAIHPEDLPRLIEDFTQAIASGRPFEWEVRGRRFDGGYRWFQSRGYPLRDASGRIVRWYNLLTDVDDRKRAEEALTSRERNARLIVNTIPGMVSLFTPKGELEGANEQALEFVGQTLEELKSFATN